MLGPITLTAGLVLAYIIGRCTFDEISLTKLVCLTFALYTSLVTLIGFYMDSVYIQITTQNFLMIFLILIFFIWLSLKTKKLHLSRVNFDRTFFTGFLILFLAGFFAYLLPSMPSFFPQGSLVDIGMHFAITKHIFEHNALVLHEAPYPILDWNIYPFGMHLNVAALCWFLHLAPIKLIYPFVALITALSAVAVYGIVEESKICNKHIALVAGFMILLLTPTIVQARIGGAWARLFGEFLVLMFVWVLFDYIKKPNLLGLAPLILIESAVILSYTIWALIPIIVFLFVMAESKIPRKDKIAYLVILCVAVVLLTAMYFPPIIKFGVTLHPTGIEIKSNLRPFLPWIASESFFVNFANLITTSLFLLSIPVFVASLVKRKNRIAVYFYAVVVLQLLSLFVLWKFFGFRDNLLRKSYYMFTYPAAIFVFVGVIGGLQRWKDLCKFYNRNKHQVNTTLIAFLVIGTILSAHVVSMAIVEGSSDHRLFSITPDEYDVAEWTKSNLPIENLTCISSHVRLYLFYVISGHNMDESSYKYWGTNITAGFENWYADAKTGEKAVIFEMDRADINLENFDVNILYKKGNACVIERR